MAKQATYKNYTVTIEDSGSVIVTKEGKQCDNAAVVLREIAESISLAVDAKWNTRQLGAKVYKEISDAAAPSAKTDKKTTDTKEKKATAKPAKSDSKELDAAQAEIERLKAELAKAQKATAPKAETPAKKSKSNDPFEGLMVNIDSGEMRFRSYKSESYDVFPNGDKRRKPETNYKYYYTYETLVVTSNYLIGKYPVTQKQWKEIMDGMNPSAVKGDELPVTNVDLEDINEFLLRLNKITGKKYRLPHIVERVWAAYQGAGELKPLITRELNPSGENMKLFDKYMWLRNFGSDCDAPHPIGKKQDLMNGISDLWNCDEWYYIDRFESKDWCYGIGAIEKRGDTYLFDSAKCVQYPLDVELSGKFFRQSGLARFYNEDGKSPRYTEADFTKMSGEGRFDRIVYLRAALFGLDWSGYCFSPDADLRGLASRYNRCVGFRLVLDIK